MIIDVALNYLGVKMKSSADRRSETLAVRSRGRKLTSSFVLLVVLLSSGCAASQGDPAAQAQVAADGESAAESIAPQPRDVGDAVDPLAPETIAPPIRPGKSAITRIPGRHGSYSGGAPAKFTDGVVVTVRNIKAGKEGGKGPGAMSGRPYVGFTIVISNGSGSSIDLNQVVVTTTYGSPARVAAPDYEDPTARDFTGKVAPGQKASAAYFFAVPTQNRRDVLTIVDFDAGHAAAVFSGHLG